MKKYRNGHLDYYINNFASDYAELLKKWGKATMEIRPLRYGCLALEIFKTVNNLNPYYMKEIFSKTTNLTHRSLDINFNQNNTTKYGSNSLQSLGPHIWNSLPREIKKEMDYKKFKNYMNNWLGLKCKWNIEILEKILSALVVFLAVHGLKTLGGKAEPVACAFLAVELTLPIIESSEEQQKDDDDAGQLGF